MAQERPGGGGGAPACGRHPQQGREVPGLSPRLQVGQKLGSGPGAGSGWSQLTSAAPVQECDPGGFRRGST